MGSCVRCVQYVLYIFNFALWLLGCALLSIGVWMKMDDGAGHYVQRMTEKQDDEYQISYSATGDTDLTVTISYLLIVFGIILIIVTFIGCCGAVRQNSCLLGTFSICLFVIMIALLSVGIWAYVKKDDVDAHTEDLRKRTDASVDRAIRLYYSDKSSQQFMDNIQTKFICCGGNMAQKDYDVIPSSCPDTHLDRRCTDRYFLFVGDEIEDFLEDRYTIISAVALGVGACLAFGILVSLLLCCCVRRSSSVRVS